jgi:hypothetical protein
LAGSTGVDVQINNIYAGLLRRVPSARVDRCSRDRRQLWRVEPTESDSAELSEEASENTSEPARSGLPVLIAKNSVGKLSSTTSE